MDREDAELGVVCVDESVWQPIVAQRASDPDADILDVVARGDHEAATTMLFERYGQAVFQFCRRSLGDGCRAEDVRQRVFIDAHRDLVRFSGRSWLRSWLFGIARHRLQDERRSRSRHDQRLEEWGVGHSVECAVRGPLADEQIDDTRLQSALIAALVRMPLEVQRAIVFRYEYGLTYEQMARICGEKPGTLQARVARAIDRLRLDLEPVDAAA